MHDIKRPIRVFSGVQPSGNLTLANYLGALKRFSQLQKRDIDTIYCVVDLHAITIWQNPEELKQAIRQTTAGFIASGINPEKSILFNQSQVSAHAELAWIFNCVARMGWLGRMTQFKEKAGSNRENASVGLFAYPTLMAADILVYHATHVPVGDDQKQHLELSRDIAIKFNNDFKIDFFPVIEPIIEGDAKRIMSLRDGTRKMSKSDPSDQSRINLLDDTDTIARKIRRAKTDAEPLPDNVHDLESRPEAQNLVRIYASLADTSIENVLNNFAGNMFSTFKPQLSDLVISCLEPITIEMNRLIQDPCEIDSILRNGSEKAANIANPILEQTYDIVGMLQSRKHSNIRSK